MHRSQIFISFFSINLQFYLNCKCFIIVSNCFLILFRNKHNMYTDLFTTTVLNFQIHFINPSNSFGCSVETIWYLMIVTISYSHFHSFCNLLLMFVSKSLCNFTTLPRGSSLESFKRSIGFIV